MRAQSGEKGILLGAKRPQWVDVVEFEPKNARLMVLVDARFGGYPPWEVVGISMLSLEFARARERLLRELVPGDIVVTEKMASVHVGDAWIEANLVRNG